jgi:phosphoglycolate phosphatase-like HAD superfamily hydrolase
MFAFRDGGFAANRGVLRVAVGMRVAPDFDMSLDLVPRALLACLVAVLCASTSVRWAAAAPRRARSTRGAPTSLFFKQALRDIQRAKKAGRRVAVVFDIDNTLVDTRHRTWAAVRSFRKNRSALASITDVSQIGYDGRATARSWLGQRDSAAFHQHWQRFFWKTSSFRHDQPIEETIALAKLAAAHGAEVYYVTGRTRALHRATVNQLRRLGLPFADRRHVVSKPRVGVKTVPFKRRELAKLAKTFELHWFVSDSHAEIAIAKQLGIPAGWVDFPAQPGGRVKQADAKNETFLLPAAVRNVPTLVPDL